MSQHDMNVANGPGLTFRTAMNAALQALASQSSGATAPNPTFPCQIWADTGTGRLRQRNSANTAWVDRGALDAVSFLSLAGGTLSGAVNDAPIQTMASATLTDIGAATSNVVAISGTTAIASLGLIAAGARRTVQFLGSLVLTHNATSLILPGNANITTAAGDTADFLSLGGGNWICLDYTYRLIGKPLDAALADFAYIYPNGGTQASPANISVNSRYVTANPFSGFNVICQAELLYAGNWAETGWYSEFNTTTSGFYCSGARAIQLGSNVVVQTGTFSLLRASNQQGNPHGITTEITTPLPCRVKVWKLKGAV